MMLSLVTAAALASLASTALQPTARALAPVPEPKPAPTCRRALQQYRALHDVPGPFATVALRAEASSPAEDRLDRLARAGATGYVIALVPETELTAEERDALRAQDGGVRVFRTVGLFVPADTARAYATCRGRVIRSY
jgi:hypothetical protein